MEIRWLGKSTFEIRSSVGVVLVDHQGEIPNVAKLPDENTVFVYSHNDHVTQAKSDSHVLTGPGEYEIGGISIRGGATPADNPAISTNINTVYVVDADGLQVASLGTPGHQPSAQSFQKISKVEIVVLNTESQCLETEELSTLIRNLEPKIVVPSGYDLETGKPSPDMNRFLSELGVKEFEPTSKLTVTNKSLPDERTIVVLQPIT